MQTRMILLNSRTKKLESNVCLLLDGNFSLFPFVLFQVTGTVFCTDTNGALVDITAKSSAYLPVQEACIHKIKHVEEVGMVPGFKGEFVIIGENEADDSLILSLRSLQYDLAWERCRQLQAEDAVVKGKVSILMPKTDFVQQLQSGERCLSVNCD